ncbi:MULTISPECIES: hypothetical protein [Pseudomonadati]|uniref:3-phosphoshikimate 1-carboxyvinyltransferase n=1 Tax=Shewanella aestuarii TaxID=1028752 RepID=A0ABT0L1Y2_9GAMM|nr:hypothetical protein [Shewanella aestuarii]MCL1117690.1 hypothetical protein [Shewanella aestuarii]GGN76500.1 hypothetical protein GCM10009193_17850 [Shewanella aestuarii]
MSQPQPDENNHITMSPIVSDIRQDDLIVKLLRRLPSSLAQTYTDEQLQGIKSALGPNTWGGHFIDNRGTFKFPFIKWRFYYVFLLGKNKRAYTRTEKKMSVAMLMLSITAVILVGMLFGLLSLYILKSALGIDLFPDTSLGIWDQVKDWFG